MFAFLRSRFDDDSDKLAIRCLVIVNRMFQRVVCPDTVLVFESFAHYKAPGDDGDVDNDSDGDDGDVDNDSDGDDGDSDNDDDCVGLTHQTTIL